MGHEWNHAEAAVGHGRTLLDTGGVITLFTRYKMSVSLSVTDQVVSIAGFPPTVKPLEPQSWGLYVSTSSNSRIVPSLIRSRYSNKGP